VRGAGTYLSTHTSPASAARAAPAPSDEPVADVEHGSCRVLSSLAGGLHSDLERRRGVRCLGPAHDVRLVRDDEEHRIRRSGRVCECWREVRAAWK